jgi:AraC family transcriptional regulator of adaptative response / DNA-3-methyladenine glycosylase II
MDEHVAFRLARARGPGQTGVVHTERESCLRAVEAKDPRFDGWFYTAVRTTGIYCRPSCPAMMPKPANITFYPSAAAAQQAGYRACKRCRPDASPGSPQWDIRADVVGRAMRMIADGALDRGGVPGLAAALGYSVRQVQRVMQTELGAGPLAIARAHRAQTARLLIETTDLSMTDVAAAAGFASVRAFNTCVAEVFATSPTDLRRASLPRVCSQSPENDDVRCSTAHSTWSTIALRLAFRGPLCPDNLFGHLIATAVPGVEEWRDGAYRRTLRLPHGPAVVALRPPVGAAEPATGQVAAVLRLADLRDLGVAIARCRRLLDLDADPIAVDEALAADPALAAHVIKSPGRRVPRTVDGPEFAVRAVLGQQVSTAAARTHAGRLVLAHGQRVDDPDGGLTHLFPPPEAIDPAGLAVPNGRRATLRAVLDALLDDSLNLSAGADPQEARARLAGLPGIGPWTTEVLAMRALGDPDAFPATDLGVRQAATRLGLPARPASLIAHSRRWAPWRSYAVQYLWATGSHPINRIPEFGIPKEKAS